jgi:hypothetical protein
MWFEQWRRYGNQVNSHDLIKAIAMILMFVDHVGLYLFPEHLWMRDVGRAAAPLFFFAVGAVNSFRFHWKLLLYGLFLSALTFFVEKQIYLNILINFVLIKAVLNAYNPKNSKTLFLVVLFSMLAVLLIFVHGWLEYGSFGLLFAIGGRLLIQNDDRGKIWLAGTVIWYFLAESFYFGFFGKIALQFYLVIICLLLWCAMAFYRQRTWELSIFKYPTLFLSRYSLQLYVLHLAFLKLFYFFVIK